ncbi:MAG: recombinase family protein [Candidatus Limnocylindrales bacterium]
MQDRQDRRDRRAGIYVRISQDREGAGLGVARQETDCRALAARLGWNVVGVYQDDDISAYSGKPRPAYRRLLGDLRGGTVDAVLAWHPDRLHRSPIELEEFIGVCEAKDVAIQTVRAGDLELGTPSGRVMARTLGAFARYESEHKAERQARASQERAKAGLWNGGGSRPFGLQPVRDQAGLIVRPVQFYLDEDEARLVRDGAARLLAGETLRGICADWNERGVTSSTGKRWQRQSLRQLLMSARLAGWREHRGAFVGPGAWPAIIDRPTSERLRAILAEPQRLKPHTGARTFLLTGFLRCRRCSERLSSTRRTDGTRRYGCRTDLGCGTTHIVAEPLEGLITEAALSALDSPALAAAVRRRNQRRMSRDETGRLAADEAALRELEFDYYDGHRLDRSTYLELRRRIEARIAATNQLLVAETDTQALAMLTGVARQRWPALSFDSKRAVLSAVIDHVAVGPGRRGYNRFDPDRVDIHWRDERPRSVA